MIDASCVIYYSVFVLLSYAVLLSLNTQHSTAHEEVVQVV